MVTCRFLLVLQEHTGTLSFSDAVELEIARLRLGVSCHHRNALLNHLGVAPAALDPSACAQPLKSLHVASLASSLELAEADAEEDRELASFGLADSARADWMQRPAGSAGAVLASGTGGAPPAASDSAPARTCSGAEFWAPRGMYDGWQRDVPSTAPGLPSECAREGGSGETSETSGREIHWERGQGDSSNHRSRYTNGVSSELERGQGFGGSKAGLGAPPTCADCSRCACGACRARAGTGLLMGLQGLRRTQAGGGGALDPLTSTSSQTLTGPSALSTTSLMPTNSGSSSAASGVGAGGGTGGSGPGRPPVEDAVVCRGCAPGEVSEAVALLRLRQLHLDLRAGLLGGLLLQAAENTLAPGPHRTNRTKQSLLPAGNLPRHTLAPLVGPTKLGLNSRQDGTTFPKPFPSSGTGIGLLRDGTEWGGDADEVSLAMLPFGGLVFQVSGAL